MIEITVLGAANALLMRTVRRGSPILEAMDVAGTAVLVERELRTAADPERSVNEKHYLKSDLVHFGVSMAVIRRTATAAVRPARSAAPPDRAEVLALVDRL